jgi:hypothetical protein
MIERLILRVSSSPFALGASAALALLATLVLVVGVLRGVLSMAFPFASLLCMVLLGALYWLVRDLAARREQTFVAARDDTLRPAELERLAGELGAHARRGTPVSTAQLLEATLQRTRSRTGRLVAGYGAAAALQLEALERRDARTRERERAAETLVQTAGARPTPPAISPLGGPLVHAVLLLALFGGEAYLSQPTMLAFLDTDTEAWTLAGLFAILLALAVEGMGRGVNLLLTRPELRRDRFTIGVSVLSAMTLAVSIWFVFVLAGSREHNAAYLNNLEQSSQQVFNLPTGGSSSTPAAATLGSQSSSSLASGSHRAPHGAGTTHAPASPAGGGSGAGGNGGFVPIGMSLPAAPVLAASALQPDLSFAAVAQVLGICAGIMLVIVNLRSEEWHRWQRERRRARWRSLSAIRRERRAALTVAIRRGQQTFIEGRVRAIIDEELARGRRLEQIVLAGAGAAAAERVTTARWPTVDEERHELLNFERLRPVVPAVEADVPPFMWPPPHTPRPEEPAGTAEDNDRSAPAPDEPTTPPSPSSNGHVRHQDTDTADTDTGSKARPAGDSDPRDRRRQPPGRQATEELEPSSDDPDRSEPDGVWALPTHPAGAAIDRPPGGSQTAVQDRTIADAYADAEQRAREQLRSNLDRLPHDGTGDPEPYNGVEFTGAPPNHPSHDGAPVDGEPS